ncbi:glycerophosphodiester phosphodiesterase [Ornithinibacillus halotolerans]|uniref:Glycerophosphoryl diester phosphodiesterase n=1 Tax=Ornithinibacillus halotolerans TaxID=1274357 RepID=A0A916RSL9_9BACI|nr:glycerophosphodiester phosphodiesterase [Ornithinibacillus halotolerans]GGA67691.1 glycerophosphoryl diester phosphodiesterase [Ornithinibacillus halotolerans]
MTTKIIAHRGASKLAPENTMYAFELAYKLGAEGIETDVQLTKDHIPVLIHDETVKRTTNGTGYVKDYTYEELKELDAGSWFSAEFKEARIITLDSFLQWVKPKDLYINIELKNNKIDYPNLEAIVFDHLKQHRILERTTLSTFNPNSVQRLKNYKEAVEIAFLTSKRHPNLIDYAKELGANALHIKYRLVQELLIEQAHNAGMPVRVYTVNKLKQMMHCFRTNCDGIFTDVPFKAMNARKVLQQ